MKKGVAMRASELTKRLKVVDADVINKAMQDALNDLIEIEGQNANIDSEDYEANISKDDKNCIYVTITKKSVVIIEYKIIMYIAAGEGITVGFTCEKVI